MFISIGVDAWRSRALKRVADRYDSQALQADALHFSTDIWSSSVVILGLAVVWGGREYNLPWLQKADPVAALFVACVVVYVSWRLARQTIDALLDAAPAGVRNNIINAVEAVPGVLEVDRVRIRRAGNRYFADLSVGLARTATFQRSEQIVAEVTQKIRSILKDVDVLVNAVPRALHTENIFDRIRAAALKHNLMVHDVSVQDLGGQLHVEQHVELDEKLSLLEAHDHVTALEADIRESVPEISSILTHIESEPATIETSDEIVQDRTLERSLKDIVAGFPDVVDVHEIILKRVREHLFLSCHVTMQDELPLSRVHDIQTALEIRFKQAAPQLFRVLIHPEPQTDNRR
jgi:divalent metal cation (Fe/Co/Zn/Cd) transporter